MNRPQIAQIGLGRIGGNMALRLCDSGVDVLAWDGDPAARAAVTDPRVRVVTAPQALGEALRRPRLWWLLVPAQAVDAALGGLPVEPGDRLIDAGNSDPEDSARRARALAARGVGYLGLGTSGGLEGARHGPSLMAGGDRATFEAIRPILAAVAAQGPEGPHLAWCGGGGAGHLVKTVHNGVEYAELQILAEVAALLRASGDSAARAGERLSTWNQGPHHSYLLGLAAAALGRTAPDSGAPWVDALDDAVGQNGTGRAAVRLALDLGVPAPSLAAAVHSRDLSADRAGRLLNSVQYFSTDADTPLLHAEDLRGVLLAARLCAAIQGLEILRAAARRAERPAQLDEILYAWSGGSILRSGLQGTLREALRQEPVEALLRAPPVVELVAPALPGWRRAVAAGVSAGLATPALSATLGWLEQRRSARLPTGLIAACRLDFGGHPAGRVPTTRAR